MHLPISKCPGIGPGMILHGPRRWAFWLRETIRKSFSNPSSRGHLLAATAAATLAFVIGWLATSPSWSMGINWDTAGYSSEIAQGTPWARTPWNSHFGVGHVYWIAMHLARALGLTALDGIRGLNGLAFAASVLTICLCALRMRVPAMFSLFVAAIYVTAWGTLILVFTWEDNVLFHPAALAAMAVCIFRVGQWRWRDSLYAGALVGISSLMSWQGAAFAFPAMYAAFFLPGLRRRWWQRLRDSALVPAGIVLARFAWVCIYWVTARELAFADLVRTAFERPTPSYLPQHLKGWITLVGKWRDVLTHLGLGVTHEIGPGIRDSATVVPYLKTLGGCLLLLAALLGIGVCLLFRRKFSRQSQFLAAGFLALTLSSAAYLDFPADKYKRYDYIPMFTSLAFAAMVGCLASRKSPIWKPSRGFHTFPRIGSAGLSPASPPRLSKWWLRSFVVVVVLAVVGQTAVSYHWNRQWFVRLPSSQPLNRAGHGGQTWFAYLRSLRAANAEACSFVFAFSEVSQANSNLEILAALVSELPQPLVVGAPPAAQKWIRPLPIASATDVATGLRGCEWISPSARTQLAAK